MIKCPYLMFFFCFFWVLGLKTLKGFFSTKMMFFFFPLLINENTSSELSKCQEIFVVALLNPRHKGPLVEMKM